MYELDFRCDSCKREYRFREGNLKELKIERDPVAEQIEMRKAEIDAARNRRCLNCGGTLDRWLACEWCYETFSVNHGELIPRIEDAVPSKRSMRDFYVIQW